MRITSVLLAIVLGAGIYLWVIEREWVNSLFASDEQAQTEEDTPTDPQDGDLDANSDDQADTTGAIAVAALRSVEREIDSAVLVRGQTEAARFVDVRSETNSTVLSDPLRRGDFVEEGTLLCALDAGTRPAILAEARARLAGAVAAKAEAESRVPESRARVAEAQARLEEAQINQTAASRLSAGGFASETRLKNADAALASAEAGLEAARSGIASAQAGLRAADANIESASANVAAAEKEIERLEIRAPFSGFLESDTAELGSLLQPGGLCARIIDLSEMKLVAYAPENQIGRVVIGASAQARLATGAQTVSGNVSFISRSADPNTRTFRVDITVSNEDFSLRDGQTAEIQISAAGRKAHLVPASALTLNEEGALGVRLVEQNNIVAFVPVSIVSDTPEGMWLSGLAPQANIIVAGQEFVTAGVKVDPQYLPAQPVEASPEDNSSEVTQ